MSQNEKPLIYLVDDEKEILSLYEAMMEDLARVMTFSTPESFIEEFNKKNPKIPDVVITDLRMPHYTGLQMVEQVFKKGFHFPVILLSGNLDKEAAVEAVDIGVFKLLEKPTPLERLQEVVEQVLIEHDIYTVRHEIRRLTSQMRELYSGIRMALLQFLPEDVFNRLLVQTDKEGNVTEKTNFESLLIQLEEKLDYLMKTETMLEETKRSYNR